MPEWRNWQTHQTQNLAGGNTRGGSTPPSGTMITNGLRRFTSHQVTTGSEVCRPVFVHNLRELGLFFPFNFLCFNHCSDCVGTDEMKIPHGRLDR